MTRPLTVPFDETLDVQIAAARARNVIPPQEFYGQLPAEKRAQAFTVSGLARLDQIQAVADAMAQAQARGETFADFQQWADKQSWALPRHRLEVIYRNAVQTSYMAGHWRHFEEYAKLRPYLMYDAINDSRTRPHHLALDGVIKPVGDVFWQTHSAPAGHNCRCSIRSLDRQEALERGGITQNPPTEGGADAGWGYKPTGWSAILKRLQDEKLAKAHPVLAEAARQVLEEQPMDGGVPAGAALPGADQAIIAPEKTVGYALNSTHPVGKDKARVFAALGFTAENAESLVAQILELLPTLPATEGKANQYGKTFNVDVPIVGSLGSGVVRTGWIVETGSVNPRLVTMFVLKEKP